MKDIELAERDLRATLIRILNMCAPDRVGQIDRGTYVPYDEETGRPLTLKERALRGGLTGVKTTAPE